MRKIIVVARFSGLKKPENCSPLAHIRRYWLATFVDSSKSVLLCSIVWLFVLNPGNYSERRFSPRIAGYIYLVFLFIFLIIPSLSPAGPRYRWLDENGVLHYTNDFGSVPPSLRKEIKTDARKMGKNKKQFRIPNMTTYSPPPPPPPVPPSLKRIEKTQPGTTILYPHSPAEKNVVPIKKSTVSDLDLEEESEDLERDKREIETVWKNMKAALQKGEIEKALTFFSESSQPLYRTQFLLSKRNLNTYIKEMGKLSAVEIKKNRAEYKIFTLRDGVAYTHPLLFVREKGGQWRIKSF